MYIYIYTYLYIYIYIYIYKIGNRTAFKIKSEYYLKLLTPETMKLLGRLCKS